MLEGNPITIQGFEIPSDSPLFLSILAVHIIAGLTCVVTGMVAIFSKKQPGVHPKSGAIYYIFMWVVFITATIMAIFRWEEDYHLFILGFISFSSAFVGRKAVKNKWKKWSITHIISMGTSYIFLLIAFYVDNGRFLPLWKNFPPVIYWLLPLLIGIPIIIKTLLQHPLSRQYFKKNS